MKIVVQGANWVGDAIMSVPALRELRRIFPDASVTLHTRSWVEGIFRDADFIDDIQSFDRGRSAFEDVRRQSKLLREQKFDLAIVLPNSFESALAAWLARVPRRFGYSKDARRLLLTDAVEVPEWKGKRHEVYYYLNLIAEVEGALQGTRSVGSGEPIMSLEVSNERKERGREFLFASGADRGKKTVGLGVGSANSRAKRWPAENYARINDFLQMEMNSNVVLFGAANETDVAEIVMEKAKLKPIDLSGKTSLETVTALLSDIDLLISNDMGLAHIAPAVGTKTITIFGPTDPDTTRPYSNNATIVRKMVECAPCMLRDCPIDHRCMTGITVEEVFDRAKMILTETGK
jgi:heptosyltransferase-2